MTTALITGHQGFVGRHIARALADKGWGTIGVDTRPGKTIGLQKEFHADIRKYFNETMGDIGPDVVIHCAAVDPHRSAIDNNAAWIGPENLSIDAALFRWIQQTVPAHAIYLSSSAAYPIALQGDNPVSLHEDHIDLNNPRQPDAIYGWTKLTGERLADLANDNGAMVSVVRPFSGYGTDQSTDFPFGAFIERAKLRQDPFSIWGDGTQIRDWVHIDDIVKVILRILDLGYVNPLNIGTGVPTSFEWLAHMVTSQAGYKPDYALFPDAPTGVHNRVADVKYVSEVYNGPMISLEEGIRRALA